MIERLRTYAREAGGRFIVFGSSAAGRMRYDSDLDVLIDFEPGRTAEAWTFAEGLCAEHGLEPDFKDVATTSPGFVEKAARSGIVLP